MNNLTNDNPFSVLFFRFADLQGLNVNRYFQCLRSIKPLLLENPDFKDSTPGFYVNRRTNEDDMGNSVRLTYFTSNEIKTRKAIQDFISANNNLRLFCAKECRVDVRGNAISGDPNEELRFRMFANTYTNIGLDLLDQNVLLTFRNLVADHMKEFLIVSISKFRTFPPPEPLEEINAEPLLSPFLIRNSKFFREKLDASKRKQLWKDLIYCRSREICFPHFLANMFAVSDDGSIDVN